MKAAWTWPIPACCWDAMRSIGHHGLVKDSRAPAGRWMERSETMGLLQVDAAAATSEFKTAVPVLAGASSLSSYAYLSGDPRPSVEGPRVSGWCYTLTRTGGSAMDGQDATLVSAVNLDRVRETKNRKGGG